MMLPTKILRLLICFCILATAAQHAAAQNKKSFPDAYRRYVKGIFKNYDLDGDDLLDADEVGKMRRKPKGADANGDGGISQEEMFMHLWSRTPEARKAKEAAARSAKKETVKEIGEVKITHDGGKMVVIGEASDVAAVEALIEKLSAEGFSDEEKIDLSVWIVKSSKDLDANELKGKSKKSVSRMLADMAEESTVLVEEFHLETNLDRTFELNRGQQVPVVEAMTKRGGQKVNQISTYEVGTNLSAKMVRKGKNISIDFKIEKSTVEDSDVSITEAGDDVVFAKMIQQFELEAEVECESDKASVVQSKESDSAWTLIFFAQ